MPVRSIDTRLDLEVTDCAQCGIPFAVPERIMAERRKNGGSFYCPNGHTLVFGETEVDKLRKRTQSLEAQVRHADDQRAAAERSKSALRGQLTRERKRAAAGVCPCCNRTFQQLSRHMQGQHPEYVAEQRKS